MKTFTDSTHIVAIKTTGNVFCRAAIDELCVKAKCWRDLLTDEPFTRKDIITLRARSISHWCSHDRVRVVNAVP